MTEQSGATEHSGGTGQTGRAGQVGRAAVLRADAALTPAGVIAPAEVAFDDAGWISYVGAPRVDSAVTHDLTGHVLMPGLVNGHTHSAMTLFRGVQDDEGFMPWLAQVLALEQHLTHADVLAGLELAMLEMIATGTVVFADMYFWDGDLLERVRDAGMRVAAAPACTTHDLVAYPGVRPWTGTDVLNETEELARRYAGDAQIHLAYGPHAPYTCPPEFIRDIAARSQRSGIPVQIHVAESAAEVVDITERYGKTPADHLESLGLFDAEVLAAHCVHLTDSEIAMFARTDTAASHNPVSNLKLGCGVAPFLEMRDAGLRLALGTDSVASNNSLDLFEEVKLATILHRGVTGDAAVLRAADVLTLATSGGAEAIGFPDTGALEPGKLADVIALDVTGTGATPFDPNALVSHLGFTASGRDVRHVFIGGRHLYAEGRHLTLDAEDIRRRARQSAERLRAATS